MTDDELMRMAEEWWARWGQDLSDYSSGLGSYVEWAQEENEDLVAMLRRVADEATRQERERLTKLWNEEMENTARWKAREARLREVLKRLLRASTPYSTPAMALARIYADVALAPEESQPDPMTKPTLIEGACEACDERAKKLRESEQFLADVAEGKSILRRIKGED